MFVFFFLHFMQINRIIKNAIICIWKIRLILKWREINIYINGYNLSGHIPTWNVSVSSVTRLWYIQYLILYSMWARLFKSKRHLNWDSWSTLNLISSKSTWIYQTAFHKYQHVLNMSIYSEFIDSVRIYKQKVQAKKGFHFKYQCCFSLQKFHPRANYISSY